MEYLPLKGERRMRKKDGASYAYPYGVVSLGSQQMVAECIHQIDAQRIFVVGLVECDGCDTTLD